MHLTPKRQICMWCDGNNMETAGDAESRIYELAGTPPHSFEHDLNAILLRGRQSDSNNAISRFTLISESIIGLR